MKRIARTTALLPLLLLPNLSALAADTATSPDSAQPDPFAFFGQEPLPLNLSHSLDYSGYFEWGLGLTSSDNTRFGRYSGRDNNGVTGIFNLDLRQWQPRQQGTGYWQLNARNLGLDSRDASVTWGVVGNYRVRLWYDEQTRHGDKDGQTPFLGVGGSYLWLPANWVTASTTAGMTALPGDLRTFEQKLQRETFGIAFRHRLSQPWTLLTSASRQEKNGLASAGAAFYLDASNPHAVILPLNIDSVTDDVHVAARYGDDTGNLELGYLFSRFNNQNPLQEWQNPYSTRYGAAVDYPNGIGGLSESPDNQMQQIRLSGNYRFRPTLMGQLDMAFAQATQDQRFSPYTVNPGITVTTALPRSSLNGEVNTTVLNASLISSAWRDLILTAKYRYEDRDNRSPRDGYLYVRGDSGDQFATQYTIYNRPTSTRKNTVSLEGRYRFPRGTRLGLGYQFQQIDRYNTSVNRTREDTLNASLRLHPWLSTSARFELIYGDRAASTYNWDQAYYALMDAAMISMTPATQRYNNHPLLSQYFLANRQRWQGKASFNYVQNERWQHNLDLQWTADDYDKTVLGLTEENHANATFSSSYMPRQSLTLTAYYSFDQYDASQRGRAFRGGLEKNAFVVIPPYPQASDPGRDWVTKPTDVYHSLGLHGKWIAVQDKLDFDLDYSFTRTHGQQHFETFGASDLLGVNLPDNSSRLHHLNANANWYVRRNVTLKFNYQYYRYVETTWARNGVTPDTLANVLWTGVSDANEVVNFVGVSMLCYVP